MMTKHGPAVICLCLPLLFWGRVSGAQDTSPDTGLFNWYYAAVFGSGVYRSGGRTITVFNLPFSHTLREPTAEKPGIRLTLPVALGIHDFHALDIPDREQIGTVSLLPGAEFPVLMRDNWTLTPYFNIGAGFSLNTNNDASATIYVVGAKSRWRLPPWQLTVHARQHAGLCRL